MATDKDIKTIQNIIHALKDHEKSTGQLEAKVKLFEEGFKSGTDYAVNLLETWLRELGT